MSLDTTAVVAAYTAGKSVYGVAKEFGITYGQARKAIVDSGTPIRDASARLKGKTRTKKSVL
jgi:hypothetical protein